MLADGRPTGRDRDQRAQTVRDVIGLHRRRRRTRVPGGDSYAQRARTFRNRTGQFKHHRFAVDTPAAPAASSRPRTCGRPLLERGARRAVPPVAAAPGRAEPACIDPGPSPGPDGMTEPVGIFGHPNRRRRRMGRTVGEGPLQVKLGTGGAEDDRHGVEQGANLGVTVTLALHRLGVQPHRDVVDEDPAVDLAEIDDVLAAPSTKASRAPTTSSRSTPRSRAKSLRVPAGIHAKGRPYSAAAVATIAWVPSPPAATPSAPAATASCTSCARSSPRCSSTLLIPRVTASSASPTLEETDLHRARGLDPPRPRRATGAQPTAHRGRRDARVLLPQQLHTVVPQPLRLDVGRAQHVLRHERHAGRAVEEGDIEEAIQSSAIPDSSWSRRWVRFLASSSSRSMLR